MSAETQTIWRCAPWVGAGIILLVPLVAMIFTEDVAWDGFDFFLMGAMLFGACGAYELAARTGNIAYRAAVGLAVVTAIVLIWINLAVGVIGSEDNPANLMFGVVLAVGIVGAFFARLGSRGMARTMVATAFAQVMVGVVALVAGLGFAGANWPWPILGLTGLFTALWLLSAWLFRSAADEALVGGGTHGAGE